MLAGLSLGCAVSIKLVGFFTFLFVGIWTLSDLWSLWGDVEVINFGN